MLAKVNRHFRKAGISSGPAGNAAVGWTSQGSCQTTLVQSKIRRHGHRHFKQTRQGRKIKKSTSEIQFFYLIIYFQVADKIQFSSKWHHFSKDDYSSNMADGSARCPVSSAICATSRPFTAFLWDEKNSYRDQWGAEPNVVEIGFLPQRLSVLLNRIPLISVDFVHVIPWSNTGQ